VPICAPPAVASEQEDGGVRSLAKTGEPPATQNQLPKAFRTPPSPAASGKSWSWRKRPTPLPKLAGILDVRIASATVRGTAAERQIVPAEMCADPANADTPHAPAILTILGRDADAAAATKATSTGARLLFAPRKHGNADTSHAPGCVYRRRTAGHAAARPGNRSGSLNR
jgi:hypothetical protein